jgi:hypothetical protein
MEKEIKQKSAVEWLEEMYNSRPAYEEFISYEEFEQAKEMEMNQTIKFGYTQIDHCVLRHGGLLIQKLPEDLWEEIYGGSTED